MAYAFVSLLDQLWVNGAQRPLDIFGFAVGGQCFPNRLFFALALFLGLVLFYLLVISDFGSSAISCNLGRVWGSAQGIGAGVPLLRVALRLVLLAVLVFHDEDIAPDPEQLIPANLGCHFRQDAVRMLESPLISGCAEIQQARVYLFRVSRLGLAVDLVKPRLGEGWEIDVFRFRHDGCVLVLVGKHRTRVERRERVLPVLHCHIHLGQPSPSPEFTRRGDGAPIRATQGHAQSLFFLFRRRSFRGLFEQEFRLGIEHHVVHRRLFQSVMQDTYPLHLFVAHEQDLCQERGYLDVLGAEFLKKIDAGGVATGGVEVFQQAGGQVV